ncbi:MAG: alpha/beta fold hydrolase [Planctomycetota bacterium]|nr:alpha/beta fold hydrolase [Planctomycetota bacterium]MDW8373502.1 alpha/beta fold hydrolase [Planctomycetota bacterium]
MYRSLRWALRLVALFALLPLGIVLLALAGCQSALIYPARRYDPVMWQRLPPAVQPLRYRTAEGEQVSFWVGPRAPRRVWMLFNGNGGFALQWLDLLPLVHDPEAGFLLFEYPGYGFSEGSCSPARIRAASEAAVAALAAHLGWERAALEQRLALFGHSLGAAAALEYAARHPVQRIVLVAPFTTLVEMGHHLFVWPLGYLIWHRFDNGARLAEIAAQQPRPSVRIIHGSDDQLVPPAMSAELAAAHPGWIERLEIPGADHDLVVVDALRLLP